MGQIASQCVIEVDMRLFVAQKYRNASRTRYGKFRLVATLTDLLDILGTRGATSRMMVWLRRDPLQKDDCYLIGKTPDGTLEILVTNDQTKLTW